MPDEAVGSSEEEFSYGEMEAAEGQDTSAFRACDRELKDMLLHKYSGYLGKLKKDFLKSRKKGKLPKDARSALMDWWNTHYRWPYPTVMDSIHANSVMKVRYLNFQMLVIVMDQLVSHLLNNVCMNRKSRRFNYLWQLVWTKGR